MKRPNSNNSLLLLLIPLLLQFLLPAQTQQLDLAATRAVLSQAMRCQNLSQLHSAAVLAGTQLYNFQLELLPNGSVVDLGRKVLLPIASISKGMFATVLPMVQEQLRKDRGDPNFNLLTTPIKQLLSANKDFWFLDHSRTDSVTIEDLTSHTTGLARHDSLSIWSGIKSKSELMQRTGRFNATGTFRGSLLYNNIVWTIADHTVETLIGMNFSAYMRQFLWQPLGMSSTVGSSEMDAGGRVQQLFRSPKHFASADRVPLERTELERSLDVVEAAGGIYAPLEDMVKYMLHHTSTNYSSFLPPPGPFKAVNAFAAERQPYDPRMINPSITDLPDIDVESYGHGWGRSWYRGNLAYEHNGAFFGSHCNLRVLPKRRLSVFTHATQGQTSSPFQPFYGEMLGHYLTDMLIRNASFINLDNVCSIFRPFIPGEPVALPRRLMSDADKETCMGSFGNYGFGTVSVSLNSSSGYLNTVYGSVALEMVPVLLPQGPSEEEEHYSFFLSILRPGGFPVAEPIVGANDTHVMVPPEILRQGTPLFMRIWRQQPGGGVLMSTPALETETLLEKGLRPETWQRPELCPPVDKGGAGSAAGVWAAAMAAGLSVLATTR